MQRRSSSSVRVFFPKYSAERVIGEVRKTIDKLSGKVALEKVMLFGSYAKKRYTVASDIDILVVFDDSRSTEDETYKALMRNIELPRLELHLLSKKEYEDMKDSKWIKIIEKEGIRIL